MKIAYIYLKGGLGNQLFIFSRALDLKEKNFTILFDISSYSSDKHKRNPQIKIINKLFPNSKIINLGNYFIKILKLLKKFKFISFISDNPKYSSLGIFRDLIFVDGYFQNYKYPKIYKLVIYDSIKSIVEEKYGENLKKEIKVDKKISLHIRRGDYLKYRKIYGLCSKEYYLKSIEILKKRYNFFETDITVFSESGTEKLIKDLKMTLQDNYKIHTDDLLQMLIMANYNFHIISNSSYSWWAALLANRGQNCEYVCICPYPWSIDQALFDKNIYYPEWKLIKNALTEKDD